MMTPLPSVDIACSMVQQEKSQREILRLVKEENEVFAMFGKKTNLSCTNCGKTCHLPDKCWACKACGKAGHTSDKCWTVVGSQLETPKV